MPATSAGMPESGVGRSSPRPPTLALRASAGLESAEARSAKAESGDPGNFAKIGWIPACAGMSERKLRRQRLALGLRQERRDTEAEHIDRGDDQGGMAIAAELHDQGPGK